MARKFFRYLAGCWLANLLCLASALGQTVTGSITGQVTDASGAVIVGATVTAENGATSVKTAAQTNGSGVYSIRFLPIGVYTVAIEASGFASQSIPSFSLEIGQTAKIDASLKIGASSTVTVRDEMHPILDTTDSSLGNTLSTNEIANIPLNGRNFSSLTLFQPGAVDTDPQGMTGNNAIERETYNNGTASINGNRAQANYYTLEGADLNEPQNNLIAYNPAPDAIAEVRVISANAPAAYGNANGGAIITILKSGTNHFHGSAYGLFENNNLDANSWGNDHDFPIVPKNHYTQSIFGGTVGGPIVKNKLFFFVDYEGVRKHTGGAASASVLTQAMRTGDFSALLAQGSSSIQLYDTQNGFAPYAGDAGLPILNPVATYLFAHPNLYPLPNATPTDGLLANNFQGPQTTFVRNNQEDFKVDWTPGSANQISGFYAQGKGNDGSTALIPVFFPSQNVYPTKVGGASWVHTFSPTIVNQFRLGFTRVRWDNSIPTDPSGDFGLTGDATVGIPFIGHQLYPGFSGQSLGNNASFIGTNANTQILRDNTFNYYDNLTWQKGRHFLSIGVQATRYQQNYLNASNFGFLGSFAYSGAFTGLPGGAGYGPADFVLDRVSNNQIGSTIGIVGNRQWRTAGYIQDDFKFSSRLTLNLGLRYEFDQPWYEVQNRTANVLPDGTVEYAGSIPPLAVAGSVLCPNHSCYNANYKQFMPRIGFAYQVASNFVVRGGYGGTSFFEGDAFNQRLTSSPPFALGSNVNATVPIGASGGSPFTVENGFAQQFAVTNAVYSAWPQNMQPAYIHEYNLTTEFALTRDLSLSLGYLGESGQHLADYRNGNQLTLAQAALIPAGVNQCTDPIPPGAVAPFAALVQQCGIVLITESEAGMNYNAGQVTLRQRTHHGLEYTVNYTFAKSLTNSSGNYGTPNISGSNGAFQDGYNGAGDYGPSGMDVRHSLNFIGVYEIPYGRGKTYGGGVNSFVDAVLGGWKVSTSAVLYSGLPITINAPGVSNTNSYGQARANQYRPLVVRDRSLLNWFGTDPSAQPCRPILGVNPNGADNGICAYGIAYNGGGPAFGTAAINTERAPGYRQVDTSLFKEFHVWGEHVVGFRADFFNIFNIASYGNPDNNVSDTSFGLISGVRSPPRQIQLSAHYAF
jgi:Carboxypeptidase regulatory-like domain/TonB dependent receptor